MSNARRLPPLSASPKKAAAMAPAAGPDSSIVTGARWASATWVSPPLDSMRRSGAGMPSAASCRAITSRYFCASGLMYALTAVVDARSYSRISGATSWEAVVAMSGWRSAMSRTASISWRGLA